MKDTKFTPRKWEVSKLQPAYVHCDVYGDGSLWKLVACAIPLDSHVDGDQLANAHLISAAPDMYEVLDAVEAIRAAIINDEMSDLEFGHLQSCLAKHARALLALTPQIKAARAKARGEA